MNYSIPFSPCDITEEEISEIVDTLKSGWITTGLKTKKFEIELAKYCGTNKFACLNSATVCMELTLRLLGIGAGDEVITSAYTYTASCSVICHVGAKPVLVDVAPNSFEMDYEKLFDVISPNTKAIIPVDIGGVLCDYDKILEVVNSKKEIFKAKGLIQENLGRVAIIADAAHSFGARKSGVLQGNFADFTCFSFHAVKNLTTGEGGGVTWKPIEGVSDDEIYKKFMLMSLHGQTKDALAKTQLGSWEYDIVAPLFKCNMTDLAASLGLVQLRRYDGLLERRLKIVDFYNQEFKDFNLQIVQNDQIKQNSSKHLYMIRMLDKNEDFRNNIIKKLANEGIASNVHFKPLPLLTAYKNLGFNINDYKNAFDVYQNEITLPLYTLLSEDQTEYIAKKFKNCLK